MTAPLLAPPEPQPMAQNDPEPRQTAESMSRPFRLGLAGLGVAVGLFARLLAANSFGELDSTSTMLAAALTSALIGIGLLLTAAERDRFGAPLLWLSAITALAWGALSWISPPFASQVTVWSNPDQAVLAIVGIGNGLLLAGIIALAFVRRHPTLSVGATLLAAVFGLAANTVLLRSEWPSIISLGIAFALILLAWDRSPRYELAFTPPENPPRVSRAALSFVSVALCGTAIQLWLSRMETPRALPAVGLCALLVAGAFVSLVRVRREIEQRETTFSEWTSWMREIRTNDFRAEMANFESPPADEPALAEIATGEDGQAPRPLSFPNLVIPDAAPDEPRPIALDDDHNIDPAWVSEPVPDEDPSNLSDLLPDSVDDRTSTPPSSAMSGLSGLVVDTAPTDTTPSDTTPSDAAGTDTTADDTSPAEHALAKPTPIERVPEIVVPIAGELPRIPDHVSAEPTPAAEAEPAASEPDADAARAGGAFSALIFEAEPADPQPATDPEQAKVAAHDGAFGLQAFAAWLQSKDAPSRQQPLIVAIEAMTLDEFESLPADDSAMATREIGSYLTEIMPTADLVSWIDGPYFIVAHASKTDAELLTLNRDIRKALKPTNGVLAFVRPAADSVLDDVVDQAVLALLKARQAEQHHAGL